jgi:hypothetical protein
MIRMARLGKLYKLMRLFRLVKVFKLLKNKDKLQAQFSKSLQVSAGSERLWFISFLLVFLLHLASCFWVLLGQYIDERDKWYSDEIMDMPKTQLYVLSFYFMTTTMTTVGYGDYSANNNTERIFLIFA